MTIEFRPTETPPPTDQPAPPRSSAPAPWIRPATKTQTEERLFHFLRSLTDGNPRPSTPLLVEQPVLVELYTRPHPDLAEALRRCLGRLLVELSPNSGQWGELELSPAVWGVALAAYDRLIPSIERKDGTPNPVADFTTALLATLPPARAVGDMLAYHALLENLGETNPRATASLRTLLNLSPLSAVYHLHLATPPPLTPLAAELLPDWKPQVTNPAPWAGMDDWLDTLAPLLDQPTIVRYLRQRWLTLPETRPACRNLGLLLEALRQREGYRDLVLAFYEAYEYFNAETRYDPWRGENVRYWPVLDEVERLLSANSDGGAGLEAAIRLNRRGSEYFLKFHALIQMIITEGRPPVDYFHLRDLPLTLQRGRYLGLIGDSGGSELDLGGVEFTGEDES